MCQADLILHIQEWCIKMKQSLKLNRKISYFGVLLTFLSFLLQKTQYISLELGIVIINIGILIGGSAIIYGYLVEYKDNSEVENMMFYFGIIFSSIFIPIVLYKLFQAIMVVIS